MNNWLWHNKHTWRFFTMVKFGTSDTKLNGNTCQSQQWPSSNNEPAVPTKTRRWDACTETIIDVLGCTRRVHKVVDRHKHQSSTKTTCANYHHFLLPVDSLNSNPNAQYWLMYTKSCKLEYFKNLNAISRASVQVRVSQKTVPSLFCKKSIKYTWIYHAIKQWKNMINQHNHKLSSAWASWRRSLCHS